VDLKENAISKMAEQPGISMQPALHVLDMDMKDFPIATGSEGLHTLGQPCIKLNGVPDILIELTM